jgi:hypothetical protein
VEREDDFFKRDSDPESPANPHMVMREEMPAPVAQSHAEVIAMDAARDSQLHEAVIRESMISGFDQSDDLDVPAFMRKRNDTM